MRFIARAREPIVDRQAHIVSVARQKKWPKGSRRGRKILASTGGYHPIRHHLFSMRFLDIL